MHVVPAYGRDYTTREETLAAWSANKDFLILGGHGTVCNKADIEKYAPADESVLIWFADCEQFIKVR